MEEMITAMLTFFSMSIISLVSIGQSQQLSLHMGDLGLGLELAKEDV